MPKRTRIARLTVVAAATLALGLTAACGGNGGDGAGSSGAAGGPELIQPGTLVVAMSGEFQPFSYFEADKLTGFDYDIAEAIGKEMGLKVEAKTGAFDTLIQGLKSNRYDVLIASMTPTPERENAVDFTDGYYSSGAQLFVSMDSTCTDPTTLDKPMIGVASGTTYEAFLKKQPWHGEIRTFSSDVTALQDAATGRLAGAMTDRLVGLYQIQKSGVELKECGSPLFTEEPAFAVDKGNDVLKADLNEALAAIKDDGTYAKISEKYFGKDISGTVGSDDSGATS